MLPFLSNRDHAQNVCNRQYGQTVPVEIFSQKNRTFSYIPSILRHVLFELLKNSMRATIEEHENDDELPPVKVIISDGDSNADVIIKISDEGGGQSSQIFRGNRGNRIPFLFFHFLAFRNIFLQKFPSFCPY